MADKRVVFTVMIRMEDPPTWDWKEYAETIRAALTAAGIETSGVALESWRAWESIEESARGEGADGATDEENAADRDSCRWLCKRLDGTEFPEEARRG